MLDDAAPSECHEGSELPETARMSTVPSARQSAGRGLRSRSGIVSTEFPLGTSKRICTVFPLEREGPPTTALPDIGADRAPLYWL